MGQDSAGNGGAPYRGNGEKGGPVFGKSSTGNGGASYGEGGKMRIRPKRALKRKRGGMRRISTGNRGVSTGERKKRA